MTCYVEDSPTGSAAYDFPAVCVEWMPQYGPFQADGDWCDITQYVVRGSLAFGRSHELERFDGSAQFTLVSNTRIFDREWTSGPFYPWLKPKRPIRISASYVTSIRGYHGDGEAFGTYCYQDDTATNSVTGDIDVRVRLSCDDWSGAGGTVNQGIGGKNSQTGTDGWAIYINATGNLVFRAWVPGDTTWTSTVATGFAAWSTHWLRFTRVAATGVVTFYTAADSFDEPIAWTQLGSTVATTAGSIVDGGVLVWGYAPSLVGYLAGNIYRALIYSGIGGTLVSDFNPARVGGLTTATSISSPIAGETWNAVNSPFKLQRFPLFRGHISKWSDAVVQDAAFFVDVSALDAFALFDNVALPVSWYELATSADRPTHLWRLDEATGTVAVDNGYGTPLAGAYTTSYTLAQAGLVNYDADRTAVMFPGGNGTASGYMNATGAAPTSSAWSIEFWFKVPSAVSFGGPAPIFVDINNASGGSVPRLAVSISNNTVGSITAGVATSTPAFATVTSASRYDDNAVYHAIVTWVDSTRTLTVYVNGASVGSAAAASGTIAFTSAMRVEFGAATGFNQNAACTLASIAVYDGVALNATQAAAHFNAGRSAHSGDDTGTQLGRVLTYKGWPTTLRSISTGLSTVGAYELPGTLREYVQRMQDTEMGATYVGPSGEIVHRARSALWLDTRSLTSQATFGDGNGTAPLVYVAEGFSLPQDDTLIRNPVYAERSGGVKASAQDTSLFDTFGESAWSAPVSFDSTDLVMLDRANFLLSRYKNLGTRLDVLTLKPRTNALLWPHALGRLLGDRITINRTPLGTGNEISTTQIVERITHAFEARQWTTTFRGSPAETTTYWILDDTTYSVLDTTTRLAY